MVIVGVSLHATGGFAAGSFYMAFKKVRHWAWESYWLVNGLFTWVIMPWVVAVLTVPELGAILRDMPLKSVFWTLLFGSCWGIGNLTFGLSLRYLGLSLGMAMTLGLTTTFGTLVPPIFSGPFGKLVGSASGLTTFGELVGSISGLTTLGGIFVCLLGIAGCGWAGMSKESELSAEEKTKYIKEFNYKKGITVAVFSGIMSACFAFAVHAGKPIRELAELHNTPALWSNSPVIVLIMAGGFITNASCCLIMNIRNRTIGNYFNGGGALLTTNYVFCAIAGITGFMEFMCYGMGTTQMGKYDFASFSIHLAFVIIFSNMWGLICREWKGCSKRTIRLIICGLAVLMFSTVIIGFGSYLAD